MDDTVLEIFYTLKEKGTFLRLGIPGSGYERIVIVSDIHTAAEIPLIAIDCPEGLTAVLAARENTKVNFEFTGEDRLRYSFSADEVFIHGDTLRITVPTDLERVQRRGDFRLPAPMGAFIYFTAGNQRKRVKMLDVSISGASGMLLSIKNGARQTPPIKNGQTILNLKLAFTIDTKEQFIPVRECEVTRVESLPQKGRYLAAVTFTRMDTEYRAQLRKLLYNEQRHILKIRQQRQ
ncbi:MAG: PilZ domain-containing protein [Desulfobacterales bacterium]|nr:PilZ domain-containing protein [Desulfobacterales bacterium]